MSTPPPDTSAGAVTQGGRTPRRGHSIWWISVVLVVLVVVTAFTFLGRRPDAPAERPATPVQGARSGVSAAP